LLYWVVLSTVTALSLYRFEWVILKKIKHDWKTQILVHVIIWTWSVGTFVRQVIDHQVNGPLICYPDVWSTFAIVTHVSVFWAGFAIGIVGTIAILIKQPTLKSFVSIVLIVYLVCVVTVCIFITYLAAEVPTISNHIREYAVSCVLLPCTRPDNTFVSGWVSYPVFLVSFTSGLWISLVFLAVPQTWAGWRRIPTLTSGSQKTTDISGSNGKTEIESVARTATESSA